MAVETGRLSVLIDRGPLLHIAHHRLDLVRLADQGRLLDAFGQQHGGLVVLQHLIEQAFAGADGVGVLAGDLGSHGQGLGARIGADAGRQADSDSFLTGTDSPLATVPAGARLNSETAGSMIDRLSILALKVHAMRQQTERTDVDDAHRAASRGKLERLQQQRQDLGDCLDGLLADAAAGRAYFKVYRQFKMYNDPRWNPQLVAERRGR